MIESNDLVSKFQYALDNAWGYIWGKAGVKWTQAQQDSLVKYFVDRYGAGWKNSAEAKENDRYRSALYGAKWIDHMVADCSGLFVWAFKELGGSIYHGSNTIFKSYCSLTGKKGSKDLLPGTAVFTGTEQSKPHIGLFIGNNTVIEAKGTTAGVITSSLSDKKWTFWGELKDVHYEGQPEPTGKPTLRKGDRGSFVTLMQTELIAKGYSCGAKSADGIFGKDTEAAVKAFQRDNGLNPDGICGQKTWAMLDSPTTTLFTVHIPHMTKYQAEGLINQYPGAWMTAEGVE